MKNLLARFKMPDQHPLAHEPGVLGASPLPPAHEPETGAETPTSGPASRRGFLKGAALGGLTLGLLLDHDAAAETEFVTQKVKRASKPNDLKITDLRIAWVGNWPILRIDTNQGISGYGEVRDGASPKYALMLKSRLLGQNPCNVEMLFKQIKQFGGHGRLAGGVCGVEMALWDLAGKAYGVPCYQMLGGKYREQIRLYADTPKVDDPAEFAKVMKERVDRGFSFLKMDFGVEQVLNIPGAVVGAQPWGKLQQWEGTPGSYGQTLHPFTRVQITPKGIQAMADYVAQVRQAVGYDIPLASDHYGHFDVNTCIQLGRAVDPYRLAWLEDMVPWFYTDQWRQISDALDTPTLTGEDIYLKEEFIKLINAKAVDMIHPDLASSGGLLETKKIGDYAEEHGIAMAMHMAGSPVCLMANIHCAAATQNFVCLEHHSVDLPWYDDLVTGPGKPLIQNGFIKVPDAPGLGIELNEKAIKEHLRADTEYFGPTDQWNKRDSWDRTWG